MFQSHHDSIQNPSNLRSKKASLDLLFSVDRQSCNATQEIDKSRRISRHPNYKKNANNASKFSRKMISLNRPTRQRELRVIRRKAAIPHDFALPCSPDLPTSHSPNTPTRHSPHLTTPSPASGQTRSSIFGSIVWSASSQGKGSRPVQRMRSGNFKIPKIIPRIAYFAR